MRFPKRPVEAGAVEKDVKMMPGRIGRRSQRREQLMLKSRLLRRRIRRRRFLRGIWICLRGCRRRSGRGLTGLMLRYVLVYIGGGGGINSSRRMRHGMSTMVTCCTKMSTRFPNSKPRSTRKTIWTACQRRGLTQRGRR